MQSSGQILVCLERHWCWCNHLDRYWCVLSHTGAGAIIWRDTGVYGATLVLVHSSGEILVCLEPHWCWCNHLERYWCIWSHTVAGALIWTDIGVSGATLVLVHPVVLISLQSPWYHSEIVVKHIENVKTPMSWSFLEDGHVYTELLNFMYYRPMFLNRRAAARYRALPSIIPGRKRFSWNLSF